MNKQEELVKLIQEAGEIAAKLEAMINKQEQAQEPDIDWESMVGRLVMVESDAEDSWHGPFILDSFGSTAEYKFFAGGCGWKKAEPYHGPHKLNMIDWHGGECPVDGDALVVIECPDGTFDATRAKNLCWNCVIDVEVAKYCVIEV